MTHVSSFHFQGKVQTLCSATVPSDQSLVTYVASCAIGFRSLIAVGCTRVAQSNDADS